MNTRAKEVAKELSPALFARGWFLDGKLL